MLKSDPSARGSTIGAQYRPPSINAVTVAGFFGPRVDVIAGVTAHMLLDRCISAGMLDQIDPDRPNPGIRIPFQAGNSTCSTQMFWDSDFGKSIEAAAYALYRKRDPGLEARVDEIVDAYGRLQLPDGYLNSWYIRIQPGLRWTNLRDCHELYDAGHLMEAAVAYYYATGKRKLLDIMCRYADHIAGKFGPEDGKTRGYCGHPEIELALVRLARASGERRYLDLARYFVDERGRKPHYYDAEAKARGEDPIDFHFKSYEYNQSHMPVRDQRTVVGHAVRAAYLYSGMADVATEFGDASLKPALEAVWEHLTAKNLYITGGFGPSAQNEGLTFDYDLPNATAYQETCASVALVFWASRMLGLGPDRRYADVMEQALYNSALSGLSLDGTRFFYDNPLESRGRHHRWIWHRCPCCPPNIARLVASIGSYIYATADAVIAVHLYCESVANLGVGGRPVRIAQTTRYPLDGKVTLAVETAAPLQFDLALRLPGWSRGATATINGEPVDVRAMSANGYLRIEREWSQGDTVVLDLPMPVERIYSHPDVGANQGRVALKRGPLVYCLEEADNGKYLNSIVLPDSHAFVCEEVDDLDHTVVLRAKAVRETVDRSALSTTVGPVRSDAELRAVPYYAWDNRAAGEMLVWVRREAQ